MNQRGFTLVEMLVALTIFALLAAAGVGLLRSSVDTQEAVGGRLAELAASERLRLLLASDLSQAVDRQGRDPSGARRPAFAGSGSALELVRAGWTDVQGMPALQRVTWRVDAGALVRSGTASLDGPPQEPAAPLLTGVRQATFRFRAADGSWREAWSPAATEAPLPAAVELSVQRDGEAPLRIVMALPPSEAPAPVQFPQGPPA
jgi:general secretion pathway protein J